MAQAWTNFTNLGTSTGPNVIRSGPGLLGAVVVNQLGSAGTTLQILDSTSSATSTSGGYNPFIATIAVGTSLGAYIYGVQVKNGITVFNTSSTGDYTVVWA